MQRFGASERESVAALAHVGLGVWLLTRLATRLAPPVAALSTAAVVVAIAALARRRRARDASLALSDRGVEAREGGAARLVPWESVTRVELVRALVDTPRGPTPLGYARLAHDGGALALADLSALGDVRVTLEPGGARVLDVEDADVVFAAACERARDAKPGALEAVLAQARADAAASQTRGTAPFDSPARAAGWLLAGLLALRVVEVLWDAPAARGAAVRGALAVALGAVAGAALGSALGPRDAARRARATAGAALGALGGGALGWLLAPRATGAWALLGGCALALPAWPMPGGLVAAAIGRALAGAPGRARAGASALAVVAATWLAARGMTVAPLTIASLALAAHESARAHERVGRTTLAPAALASLAPDARAALRSRVRAAARSDRGEAARALARDGGRLRDEARLVAVSRARAPLAAALLAGLALTAWALARLTKEPDARVAEAARIAFR